jgi:CelD/BcsL family acetyltransferase involved in cellulose biosynthesis
VVVRDAEKLASFIPAWEELADAAIEPNVFYEHWMLLPALQAFGDGEDILFVLVLIRDAHDPLIPPKLGALFPLQRLRRYKQLPASAFRLWRHVHCYLATPLVRADAVRECLDEFFRWLQADDAGSGLIEFCRIRGDGRFHRALVETCNELGLLSSVTECYTRGLLRTKDGRVDAEISGSLRRTLRRKERRLTERGRVEHAVLGADGDIERWIEAFLNLEAGGWKGRHGSALACSDADRGFFTEILSSAFRRRRLLMIGIDFDGRSIACRCSFTAGEGSYAFKTAYDEEFAHFSPGVMLEVDNLRQVDGMPEVRWMDSCTTRDNFTINRLWKDRVTILSLAVGRGSWSELLISAAPILQWFRRRIPLGS